MVFKTWVNQLVTVALHDQEPGGSQTKTQVKHIGAPGCLVTNLVTNLVNNLVIHWILWSIWWYYWWHILWVAKFVTTFGDISFTHFGDPLKLSPDLVTYISQNLSLNQFTKFITKLFTKCFPIFRDKFCHPIHFTKIVTNLITIFVTLIGYSLNWSPNSFFIFQQNYHNEFHHTGHLKEQWHNSIRISANICGNISAPQIFVEVLAVLKFAQFFWQIFLKI